MATVPYTFANAPGGSAIPLEELDANFAALQGVLGPTGPTGPKGADGTSSSLYYYRANTASQSGDPGLGYLSWNSTTQIGSNIINLSHQTSTVVDIDIFLTLLEVGQEFVIQDVTSSLNYQKWIISGAVTNINPSAPNSYFIVPSTLIESGGVGTTNFPNNSQLFFAIASNPPGPTGPTGPTGASITGPTGATGATGAAGIATPAGSVGQIQFNNSSVLGADSRLFWDNTNKRLGVGTSAPQYTLESTAAGSTSAIFGNNTGTGSGVSGQGSSGDGIVGTSSTGYAGSFYGKLRAPSVYSNAISGRNVVISTTGEFGYGASTNSITLINTIANLRTTTPINGQVVYVSGYYNPGDGGGGYFVGLTGSTNFIDNGGTRITTAYGASSTSVWIRGYYPTGTSYILGNYPMNVLYFGAYSNGTNATTTRTAIQNAINAVAATGRGGTVYFPAGQYAIDSALSLANPSITLAGDNLRASQIVTSSSSINMLEITGLDTAKIQDLAFTRTVAPATKNVRGISITNSGNITFSFVDSVNHGTGYYTNNSGVQFYNCRALMAVSNVANSDPYYGFFLDSQNGLPNASCNITDSTTNLQPPFAGTAYGVFVYGQNVKDVFIRNFEFADSTVSLSTPSGAAATYGIWIEATQNSGSYQDNFDITISGAVIDSFKGEGILLAFVSSATVTGCWINPRLGSTNNMRIQNSGSVTVTGCEFFGDGNYASNIGLKLASSQHCNVTGNTFLNNLVSLAGDSGAGVNAITGNSFNNIAGQTAAAQIQIAGYRTIVTSNVFDGSATYAIQLYSGSGYNVVSLNSTNTLAIINSGSNNQVLNNMINSWTP